MATPAAILSILVKADGISKTSQQINTLDKDVDKAGRRGHKSMMMFAKGAGAAGVALGVLGVAVGKSVSAFQESEKISKQTNAVLKSTGGVAKVSAKHVDSLANSISKKSGVDDEAIKSGENLLLTFTNVRNEVGKGNKIFDRATQIASDMSVALGQDLKSSNIQLGKALNDPVKGITALSRVGVSFTADQKKQIKGLAEHGKTLDAQKIILRELNKEFGGSAAAQATNMDRLKVSFGNFQESVGGVFAPVVEKAAGTLSKFFDEMQSGKGAGGAFVGMLKDVGAWLKQAFIDALPTIKTIGTALQDAGKWLKQAFIDSLPTIQAVFEWIKGAVPVVIGAIVSAFNTVKGVVGAVVGAVSTAVNAVIGEVSQWDTLWDVITGGASLMVAELKAAFDGIKLIVGVAMVALGPIITAAWTLIKGIFSGAWTAIKSIVEGGLKVIRGIIQVIGGLFKGDFGQVWEGIKTIFSGGITALKGILEGAWKILKAPVEAIAAGLHDAFENTWGRIKGIFEAGVNAVIGFLNVLIAAINVIPGVSIKPIGKLGGDGGGGTPETPAPHGGQFARGGAYAKTGGYVNSPITLMGEDAPRYPEWVIPTNPAYRGRAKGLLASAAMSLGMASGGQYSQGEIMDLWTGQHGASQRRLIASAVAMAESSGNAGATSANPAGGSNLGLWQIWSGNPGATLNPAGNARAAINLSKNGADWHLWEAFTNGNYRDFMGSGRGAGLPSAGDILSKFPSPDSLPAMFKGVGKYVIGKATSYVKSQVRDLFSGQVQPGTMGLGGPVSQGLVPQVIGAIQWARGHGWGGQVTSGFRSYAEQARLYARYLAGGPLAARPGTSSHEKGEAIDVTDYQNFGRAMASAPAGSRLLNLLGARDPVHYSVSGYAKGGKFLGSFAQGGITGSEGLAHLHANEAIIPLKTGGKLGGYKSPYASLTVNIGAGRYVTIEEYMKMIASGWDPSDTSRRLGPVTPSVTPNIETPTGPPERPQADIDRENEQIAATNRLADLIAIQNANQLKIIALANQGPQVIAAVVAAVSGGIGGRVGLGFQSPSYAGGIARYK
jgi:phage-related protein